MSQFLEQNKKKGALASLLLFLKRGKGVGPFLLMAVILGGVFVMPSGLSDSPWLMSLAQKVGLGSLVGGGDPDKTAANFDQVLRNARRSSGDIEDSNPLRDLPPPGASFGRSSVSLAQEKAREVAAEPLPDKPVEPAGRTVDGVLGPEDAKKTANGVPLREEELHKGLNNAMAGTGFGFNNNNFWKTAGSGFGSSGSGFQPRAAERGGSLVSAAMDKSGVPGVGPSGFRGRLGPNPNTRPLIGLTAGSDPAKVNGKSGAMYQLAEGRAFSVAAAPGPGGMCQGNCPNEYAMNASGISFDGKRQPTGGILGSQQFGDPAAPVTPDGNTVGATAAQGAQAQQDAQRCQQAEQSIGPQERSVSDQIQKKSDEMNNLNCNSGGCGGNVDLCKQKGDEIKALCNQDNDLLQQIGQACSAINGGNFSHRTCN